MRALRAAVVEARFGLRARRRRALLTAIGIALAAAMLSAAVVVSYGLGTGFDRSARAASLPDIIVRFNDKSESFVRARINALPDVARYQLRYELTNVEVGFRGMRRGDAVAEVLNPGPRRGYAVVAGRDLSQYGREVLIERAFADAWGIRLGDRFYVGGLGPLRVVGFVEAPDNVGYPLAKPRFYLSEPAIERRFGITNPDVNLAEIWLRNPAYVNEVLTQARATSFGLQSISYATRGAVRVLLDQAAGIVIDLLVAISLIALVTAGVMLAASARAEVQRRLGAIGVRRAVGTSRSQVTLTQGVEGLLVSMPAAFVGVVGGFLAVYGPSAQLLELLNEPAPGAALAPPLLGAFLVAALAPALGAAWPAWRAGRGPVVGLLRGADVGRSRLRGRRGRSLHLPAGLTTLGARLVAARRARLVATAVTLGLSAGFVLLILALASELSTLETDPSALGERYQLTSYAGPSLAPLVARIPGVQAAAPRYELQAADAYSLGELVDVIAFPGNHTVFEAPPLVSGNRLRGRHQAEVGEGLANALGLGVSSTLLLDLPSGNELRLRVSGIVSSLDHDGRVAYVPASALLQLDPNPPSEIAVVLKPNADQASVEAAMTQIGAPPTPTSGTARGATLVDVLRTILRAIAIVDGLVCLYALLQACALTVQERRRTVAVVRACGAGAGAVRRLLTGAALALVIPAAVIGILLERIVFGPALSHLAENYAALPLNATLLDVLAVVAGLAVAAGVAVLWVSRQAVRESVVAGLGS